MKVPNHEKLLLQGLGKNDRKSVETIYKDNYKMVQTLIINNNGTLDDAKDIFQEAMMVLYERAKSETFELNCQIKTYMYSVCRRLWLKRLSQTQNKFSLTDNYEELAVVDQDMEEQEQRDMDFNKMETAISHLGEPCKSLLEAFYLQKKSMQEIASDFGYTNADNAKTQKYKCLARLKKLFFNQYKTDLLQ